MPGDPITPPGRETLVTTTSPRIPFVPLGVPTSQSIPRPNPLRVQAPPTNPLKRKIPKGDLSPPNDYPKIPVGGRLFRFRTAWKGAHFESVVKKGLSWSWLVTPPPLKTLRQNTPQDADKILSKLRRIRVIEKARVVRFLSRVFTVPKKDSQERRLILDLSILNTFIECPSFKMLTLKEIKLLLPRNFWTTSLDLKDGFWHVPVSPSRRAFLCFRWRNQFWQFRAMPFGLCVAPRIFTKVIAHVVKVLAKAGIWCLPYLDDLLIVASSKEECEFNTRKAIEILNSLGWILNSKKSRLVPAQAFTWLGVFFDLREHTASTPTDTMSSFQDLLTHLILAPTISVRDIMRLQGLANWISLQDPIVRLILPRTRRLIKSLRRAGLDTPLTLSNSAKLSLCRWIKGPPIPQSLGSPSPNIIIQTDACLSGWGFQIDNKLFSGSFSKSMTYSINVLETLTVWFSLLMIKEKGVVIQVLTDNSSAIAAIRRNSSLTFHLSSLSDLIWRRAARLNWTLTISHIQGSFNIVADQLSRRTEMPSEWSLSTTDFKKILSQNPRLQVDLFATSLNKKLPTYISPCPDNRAAAVDSLTSPWTKWKHLYLFPPTPLISRALAKMTESSFESAILITPDTPSRPWFMSLDLRGVPSFPLKARLQQVVVDQLVVQPQASKLRVWKLSGDPSQKSSLFAMEQ